MNCQYEWFQEGELPEPEDVEPDKDADTEPLPDRDEIEPIPESVKPVPEGSEVPAIPGEGRQIEFDKARYMGYAAAASVLLAIMGGFIAAHKPIVRIWPATMSFYDKIGMETKIDGENLIFEQLKAVASGLKDEPHILKVSGRILNLSREESKVPHIQTSLIMTDGEAGDSWVVTPDNETLAYEGEMGFETSYPDVPMDVKEVNVKFIVGDEIKAEKATRGDKGSGDGKGGEGTGETSGKDPDSLIKGTFLGGPAVKKKSSTDDEGQH